MGLDFDRSLSEVADLEPIFLVDFFELDDSLFEGVDFFSVFDVDLFFVVDWFFDLDYFFLDLDGLRDGLFDDEFVAFSNNGSILAELLLELLGVFIGGGGCSRCLVGSLGGRLLGDDDLSG